MLRGSPGSFAAELGRRGRRRAAFVREGGVLRASDPALADVARFVEGCRDGDRPEAVFLAVGERSGVLLGAFLHRSCRGQTQGGLRNWPYPRLADFLEDGVRLARDMGRKCALAGLWWGGGKGVIASPTERLEGEARARLYRDYGDFVTSLRGVYVTAEDVGTTPEDVAHVFERTRFVTCIPPDRGGSGNPSSATATGVACAMEAALEHLGEGGLEGARVAMQGVGQVGAFLIEELLARDVASIVASEISAERRAVVLGRHPGAPLEIRRVEPGDDAILAEACDVLAPNALGGVLGPHTIPKLRTRLICGAANSQLVETVRDARAIAERGITCLPDFLVNRLGIVQCANEQYGAPRPDPAVARHLDARDPDSIPSQTRRLLGEAGEAGITPTEAALRLADARVEERHPLWGDRGAEIVATLVREDWAAG